MKNYIYIAIVVFACKSLKAQVTESLESTLTSRNIAYLKVLSDNLGISSKEATAIWKARDGFLHRSSKILADTSFGDSIKQRALVGLQKRFTQEIQEALGMDVYTKYVAFVRRRMQVHGNRGKPLAIE